MSPSPVTLKDLREARGLSRRRLAKLAGISASRYCLVEARPEPPLTIRSLRALAPALAFASPGALVDVLYPPTPAA